jgi:hypothetical protein
MNDDDEPARDLGPCCVCERAQDGTVRTLVMLDFEAPSGVVGWGCLQCGLPMRGATAIVCDACCVLHLADLHAHIKFILGGKYPADRVRVSLDGYEREPFDHRLESHIDEIDTP